jgi:hypothetical protein
LQDVFTTVGVSRFQRSRWEDGDVGVLTEW